MFVSPLCFDIVFIMLKGQVEENKSKIPNECIVKHGKSDFVFSGVFLTEIHVTTIWCEYIVQCCWLSVSSCQKVGVGEKTAKIFPWL